MPAPAVPAPSVPPIKKRRAVFVGTPGRLRGAGAAAVVACLVFGFGATGAVAARSSAIADARNHAAQLVRVQNIRSNLTQADAAATNAFLVGGLEPADQRASYTQGIAGATEAIADAAAGSTADAAVFATTNHLLAEYAGLIESARANNRQGFPIGAAYLRQASDLLRLQILPPLSRLVTAEQSQIATAYADAANANVAFIVVLVLGLFVLVVVQIWLSAKTRRTVNIGLGIATVMVVVTALAGEFSMAYAQKKASDTRRGSLATTDLLATARTDAFDAKSQESIALINRGSGAPFEAQYQVDIANARAALQSPAGDSELDARLAEYDIAHQAVRKADNGGNWDAAVALATGNTAQGTKPAFAAFDARSKQDLTGAAAQASDGLNSARRPLDAIVILLFFAGIAAAVLAWRGIAVRLREYR